MPKKDETPKTDDAPKKDEAPAPSIEKKTAEQLAKELATPTWLFAAAKALHAWPIGMELTTDEYKAALDAAANVQIR